MHALDLSEIYGPFGAIAIIISAVRTHPLTSPPNLHDNNITRPHSPLRPCPRAFPTLPVRTFIPPRPLVLRHDKSTLHSYVAPTSGDRGRCGEIGKPQFVAQPPHHHTCAPASSLASRKSTIAPSWIIFRRFVGLAGFE